LITKQLIIEELIMKELIEVDKKNERAANGREES